MMQDFPRKLNVLPYDHWDHHHSGWKFCVDAIKGTLSNTQGVDFYPNQVYRIIHEQELPNKKWIGVLHTTPTCLKSMENQLLKPKWQEHCLGLFVFSNHTSESLRQYIDKPVCVLTHPIKFTDKFFKWDYFVKNKNKQILFIGGWLRETKSFEEIVVPYCKTVIKCPGAGTQYSGALNTINYLPPDEYEQMLQQNLVYLDFSDTTTNNTMLECIVRNTPICVRRHPSVVEHLGEGYPLYFSDNREAEEKLNCMKSIESAFVYLSNKEKSTFSSHNFINQIVGSSIYKSIRRKYRSCLLL